MSKSMSKINVWRLWRGGKRTGENEKSVDGREERGERRGLGDETGGMSRRKTERKGEGRWQENRVEKRRSEDSSMITVGWKGYNADLCECFWILLVKCLAVLTNAFEYFRCSFHCSCASVHDRWLWVIYGIPLHIPAHTQAFSNQAFASARFLSATEMLLVNSTLN